MSQTLTEKSAKTTSERGAELVDLIIDGLHSARLLALKDLGRHTSAAFLRKVEKTGNQNLIQEIRQQAVDKENEYDETEAEFNQTIRRLMAIKLSLEGKAEEEIEEELAQRDRNLAEAKAMLAGVGG
jgi:hypothetical protein